MDTYTKAWWKDTIERFIWTLVQGGTSVLVLDSFGWVDFGNVEVWQAVIAGGAAAGLSFLKALAGKVLSSDGTAQLGTRTYSYTASGPGSAGGDMPEAPAE